MGCLSRRGAKGRIVGLRVKQGVGVGLSDSMLKLVFEILVGFDGIQLPQGLETLPKARRGLTCIASISD